MASDKLTGKVIAVKTGGMTQLEKEIDDGTFDIEKYAASLPGDTGKAMKEEIARRLKDQEDANLARIQGMTPNIASPKTLSDLPIEKQNQIFAHLQGLQSNPVPSKETPIPSMYSSLVEDPRVKNKPVEPKLVQEAPVAQPAPEMFTSTAVSKRCPNCSWDTSKQLTEPTLEDKHNWLRALFGGTRFQKTYSLFGNRLSITFRTRSLYETKLISEQLVREHGDGRIPGNPPQLSLVAHNLRMLKLDLAASLVQISGIDSPLPTLDSEEAKTIYGSDDADNVIAKAHDILFGKWTEALYNTCFKQFNVFDELCMRLKEAAASPDFWEEIG